MGRCDLMLQGLGAPYVLMGVLVFCLTGMVDAGTLPPTVGPDDLDGVNGFAFFGAGGGDLCGDSVAGIGDINADGYPDLAVGATEAGGLFSGPGETYVVFGGPGVGSSGSMQVADLNGSNGFVVRGISNSTFSGYALASGDINGDGIVDLVIGTPARGFVVFGGPGVGASGVIELDDMNGMNGFRFNGPSGVNPFADAVAAGDVNDDGIDDLIIGARHAGNFVGDARVVFGAAGIGSTGLLNAGLLDGSNGFVMGGESSFSLTGLAVSASDINGDGIADILIAARDRAYAVFGGAGVGDPSGVLPLNSLDGTNGLVILDVVGRDGQNESLSGAGDFNGDGVGDMLIGSVEGTVDGVEGVGYAHLLYGDAAIGGPGVLGLDALGPGMAFRMEGTDFDRGFCGAAVSWAGDINRDGYDDVVVCDPGPDTGGLAYIVFGRPDEVPGGVIDLGSLNTTTGLTFVGAGPLDETGHGASSIGDFNADGAPDVIIGAPRARNLSSSPTGAAYVLFGRCSPCTCKGPDCNDDGVTDLCEIATGVASDENGDGIPDACQCLGDIAPEGGPDGSVNIDDLNLLLVSWGGAGGAADFTGDGLVNFHDLNILLERWGLPCEG